MIPQLEVVTVSNSEVETYRQCRLKHQLQYIELWRTEEEAEALARGTLFHLVMEGHYKAIQRAQQEGDGVPDVEDLFLNVAPLLYEEGTGNQTERQELVEWMYRGYVEEYGVDEEWEIVAVEYPLDEPLYHRDGSPSSFKLAGTIDLIVRDKAAMGGLWLVDHKSCKSLPKKDFDLEDQTAIYTLLARLKNWELRGAIYNHVRTNRLKTREMGADERYKRSVTVRGSQELETCAFEVLELMEEAYARDLKGPAGGWRDAPRSPDGERCGWKCNLTEACLAGRKGGPERTRQFLIDTGFTIHDTKPGPTFNKGR